MKTIIILSLLSFSFSLFAAKDSVNFKKFNQSFSENMDEVLSDNPEVYESSKFQGRIPASIVEVKPENQEKLDHFEEQAFGKKSW